MNDDSQNTPPVEANTVETGATRRAFLGRALAAGGGLALGPLVPAGGGSAEAQTCAFPTLPQKLETIAEIKKTSPTGPVQGAITVLNENKSYLAPSKQNPGQTVCDSGQMRYFQASLPGGAPIWPSKKGIPAPGPTIRARVGDTVEITLLNQVDVAAFGNSLDSGERGEGCDVFNQPTTGGGSINTYPGNPPFDNMPDCFHGSSTENLHYHGTHVSPNIIEDNIFVQLRPSPRVAGKPVVNEAYLKAKNFNRIFTNCQSGHSPEQWRDLPLAWQQAQEQLLKAYDKTANWQGHAGLPPAEQLWPKNETDIKAGRWPSYFIGAYPSCFKLPAWNGQDTSMGQSPGTHWYHAHKHGSTALNLSNGMAGAFIIEGDYDDKLRPFFNKEVVLVLQQYGKQLNLVRAPGTNTVDLIYVNGQYTPLVPMQPGEVQLWRIVNACHQAFVPITGVPVTSAAPGIRWIQTAQDGVQLSQTNYQRGLDAANTTPGTWINSTLTTPMTSPPWFGSLAPGNRVDLLVQAPSATGSYPVKAGNTLLFTVNVSGNAIPNPISFPPPAASFPVLPGFLKDIEPSDAHVRRELRFKTNPKQGRPTGGAPPAQTINGKLFQDHHVDQTMLLGATEEWTLYNDGGPAHPFHIHVNPFQVTEILNPAVSKDPFMLTKEPSRVWWDVISLPPPAVPPNSTDGKPISGYVKFLSRFVDFTGTYVLHCHILGHEDRGMMQMVEVVSATTTLGHH